MLDTLIYWDESLFFFIHKNWQADWLDSLMPLWRNKYFWIPVYIFITVFLTINYKKRGLLILFFAVLTIALSDTLSSKIFKPLVNRVRPCNVVEWESYIHQIVPCGGGKSFPSSHSTNHFALSTFLILLLGGRSKLIIGLLAFWAISIGFGQIYVGLHYPSDVFCGAILGIGIGSLIGSICKKRIYFVEENWSFK